MSLASRFYKPRNTLNTRKGKVYSEYYLVEDDLKKLSF